MRVDLKPVYSRLADEIPEELQGLGLRLSQHQVETYRALRDPIIKLIFNTSLTGDGKSLAGMSRHLIARKQGEGWHTLAMYPTNELIRDQYRGFEHVLDTFFVEDAEFHKQRTNILDSRSLDEAEQRFEHSSLSRGETLYTIKEHSRLLLTNPDIFHLIMQFRYIRFGQAQDRYVAGLWSGTDQLTFDEFHLFEAPQVAAILTALMFLYRAKHPAHPLKTVFLSATPDAQLQKELHTAGFAPEEICVIQGEYCYEPGDIDQWRQILQAARLEFFNTNDCMTWLDEHLPTLREIYRAEGEYTRGAIILDSVDRAIKVYERLKHELTDLELVISLNTGLRRSVDWNQADLVVATSTVDVGVDFAINLLVFEANDASRCIQRLGRLGRHKDFRDRDGQTQTFQIYRAFALVPTYIYARLSDPGDGALPALQEGQELDRQRLQAILQAIFPSRKQFFHYLQDWGKYLPAQVIKGLSNKEIWQTYTDLRMGLLGAYPRVFKINNRTLNEAIDDLRATASQNPQAVLYQEACSFRGGSTLKNSAVLLGSGIENQEPVTEYNLLWLLQRTELEWYSREQFLQELEQRVPHLVARYERQDRYLAYFKLHAVAATYREITIDLTFSLDYEETEGVAQVIRGIELSSQEKILDAIDLLNNNLRRKPFIVTTLKESPQDARFNYYLPGFFRIYPCRFKNGNPGSIAFDREALLLDSLFRHRKPPKTSSNPFII